MTRQLSFLWLVWPLLALACMTPSLAIASQAPIVTTLAGSDLGHMDGVGTNAALNNPIGTALNSNGTILYFVDSGNNLLRAVAITSAAVTTLAGGLGANHSGYVDGVGTNAAFSKPAGVALSPVGATLFVADTYSHVIRAVAIASATVSTLAGGLGTNRSGHADGVGTNATFDRPYGVAVDPFGTVLYVGDYSHIRAIVIANASVTTLVGGGKAGGAMYGHADGVGTAALFHRPYGIARDAAGAVLYVGDTINNVIRAVDVASATVTTLAGGGGVNGTAVGHANGVGTAATFDWPICVAIDPNGTTLYVSDDNNNFIRAITIASATVTTLAGTGNGTGVGGHADGVGSIANFSHPHGLALSPSGDVLYVADNKFNLIRIIALYPSGTSTPTSTSTSTSSSTSSDTSTGTATSSSISTATATASSTSSSTATGTASSSFVAASATPSTVPGSSLFDAAVSLNTNFTSLTVAVGTALRCDLANITSSPLSEVVVLDYKKSDGTVFDVLPSDPMNTAVCGGLGFFSAAEFAAERGLGFGGPLAPSVILVNATAVVPYRNISAVVAAVYAANAAAFVHVNALVAADPELLPPGASAGVSSVAGVSAYQASPSVTPAPAPAADRGLTTSLGAAIGGLIAAIVALAGIGICFVTYFRRRKLRVGDRFRGDRFRPNVDPASGDAFLPYGTF